MILKKMNESVEKKFNRNNKNRYYKNQIIFYKTKL